MKQTLTLNDLSRLLVERYPSLDNAKAENFISTFFRSVAASLQADEHVTIDGFGTFARNSENHVTFIPDPSLAGKVNEPFSFFEAVELDDKFVDSDEAPVAGTQTDSTPVENIDKIKNATPPVTDDLKNTEKEVPAKSAETAAPVKQTPVDTNEANEATVGLPETSPKSEAPRPTATDENKKPAETVQTKAKQPVSAIDISDAYSSDSEAKSIPYSYSSKEDVEMEEYRKRKDNSEGVWHLPWWIPALAGLFIGFVIGYGINLVSIPDTDDYDSEDEDTIEEVIEQIQVPGAIDAVDPDSIADEIPSPKVEEQPVEPVQVKEQAEVQQPKTDVVKSGYYLTSMARKYYGKTDFWCYIYEENKAKLGNPNKIPAGTEVVIPPAEKYSINKDDSESLKRAAAKIAEINAKYK